VTLHNVKVMVLVCLPEVMVGKSSGLTIAVLKYHVLSAFLDYHMTD
jgi:hypothetical protein